MKLLTLLLLPFFSFSQEWYKITKNDYKLMGGSAAYGGFYAVNQAIIHHHLGRGNQFWDKNVSWKNKYKDFDNGDTRAKFFMSKTVLVPVTDGFHLTQFAYRSAGLVTLAFAISDFDAYPKKDRWKVVGKKLLICTITERIVFNTVFALLGSH